MREHPVPQDITGYQFHIIGEMTIKQFAEVGLGVILGVVIYTTNLPGLLKWPLIVIFVATGAMAAFVPIEEQPLDHWIITFFKSLYKPTQYYWKKDARLPEAFAFKPSDPNTIQPPTVDFSPARRERIKEFLSSLPEEQAADDYTQSQNNYVSQILATFDNVEVTQTVPGSPSPGSSLPNLTLRTHSLRAPTTQEQAVYQGNTSTPAQTKTSLTLPMATDTVIAAAPSNVAGDTQHLAPDESTQDVLVPQNQPISVATTNNQAAPENPEEAITYSQPSSYIAGAADQVVDASQLQQVVDNVQLPFPAPPQEPNKVVGMTLSSQNDLLHEVIIEIKTPTGQVVRAVKSNSLGQFFISTPLRNGTYIVTAEKEGYQFPDQQLILNGTIVNPLEIRSS